MGPQSRRDKGVTPRTVFQAKHAPRERREGRLHQAGELPQTLLQNSESRRDRAERDTQSQTSFCDPTDKRCETAKRHNSRIITSSGSRLLGSQHLANYGDVLC